MKDLVKGMIEERKELEKRLDKLEALLRMDGYDKKTRSKNYRLMLQQADAMTNYYITLSERIELLK